MDNSNNPVLLGIVSSLIATFIFLTLSRFFYNVILPWYGDKIYRGVRIDGKWELDKWSGEKDKEFVFNLKQKGDMVEGTHFHRIAKSNGTTVSELYEVRGNVRDGYFFAILDPISKEIVDSGTVHMKIYKKDNCLRMKGNITAVSSSDGNISSINNESFTKTGQA